MGNKQQRNLHRLVIDGLPKPSMSTHPAAEATWGQSVNITCSASTLPQQLFSNTTFILEKSSSYRESQTPGSSSASFSIQEVNLDHEGWYRCQYQIRVPGRDFRSPFSDSVRLSVAVPLQQPNLSLTSPSRGLFWSPDGAEVTRAGPEQQGNYSCLYEVTLSSRTFTSTGSTPHCHHHISCDGAGLLSVCGGGVSCWSSGAGGVFFFLIRRRRPGDLNQTRVSVTAINEEEDEEDEEDEEEENVYVNVDDLVPQKKQKSGRGEEEDIDVYEQQEICANFREGEEDGEERESSDDEDDYVNAAPASSEQVVSGDDEDDYVNAAPASSEQVVSGDDEDDYVNAAPASSEQVVSGDDEDDYVNAAPASSEQVVSGDDEDDYVNAAPASMSSR
ncbi:Replicase polyprotein 1a [Dissostichus eleginoides]|uniref:Replicase polyprotein 1a n=1 Tax=Dissostichus eleginoides TaxID=100907 RepID=A0AAD9CAU6_DISEL|nr:Replicase polyprotein 1a [Dissostichus eleginoides]